MKFSFRRGGSTPSRAPWPEDLERTEPLQGRPWVRPEGPRPRTRRRPRRTVDSLGWRALALGIALLEIAALGWLWSGQALGVHSIQVTGARHLTAAQVAQIAGVTPRSSVISIDAEGAQKRLLDQVWIRTAEVDPQLPGRVLIKVTEWQPVAVYHSGASKKAFYLSDQSIILGPATPAPAVSAATAATPAALLAVQGPAGPDPRPGDRPLDSQLLTALVNIQRGLPSLIGQQVSGFIFDSCGDLTMVAKPGWKVYFGRVLTPEEFAGLRDKLAALQAIAGHGNVDYSSTDLEYVNVMNPSEPAVGLKSREPAPASPTPGATPAPPSPSPPPSPCK